MPTIPTYDGPQIHQAGLPGVFQQAPDVSSGTQSIAKGLAAVSEVADKIDLQQSTQEAQDAEVRIRGEWFKADQELRTKYSGQKIGGYQAAVDAWWKEAPQKYGQNLTPRAQFIASKSLIAAQEMAQRTSATYAHAETERLDKSTFESAKWAVLQGALTAVKEGDPLAAPIAVDDIREKNAAWAKARNLSADELAALNVRDLTVLHANVINQLAETDPAAARQYWKELDKAKQFDASKIDEIDKTLKVAATQHTAQAFGDEVMSKRMSLEEALAEARKRFDGKDEEMALQEVKTRFTEQEVIQARSAKAVEKQGWSILMAKGSMSAIPPALMTTLREQAPEAERQMRDWLDAKRRQAKAEAEGVSDPDEFGRYYTYRRMAMENPQQFADLDLTKAQPYVSKAQLNHLVEIQGGINRNDAKAMELNRQVKIAVNSAKSAILAGGLDMTPKEGTPAATEFNNFMGAVTMKITDAQRAAEGKPLPPEKLKEIAMDLVREKYEQGTGFAGIWRTKRKGYQILNDPNSKDKHFIDVPYDEIPKDIRAELEADTPRKRVGRGTTEIDKDAVERAYQKGKEEGRF